MMTKRDSPDEIKDAEAQAPGYTPGRLLREARERRNLSREQLAAQLKLSPKLVADLEDENHAALPASVFVRGYLNAFARHLDMNAEELLAAYSDVEVPLVKTPKVANAVFRGTTSSKQQHRVKRWGSIVVVLVLAVLTLIWWQEEIVRQFFDRSEEKASNIAALPKPLPSALPVPADSATDSAADSNDTPTDTAADAEPEAPTINTENMAPDNTVVATDEPTRTEAAESSSSAATEPESSVPPTTGDQLVLRASGDSWTEVTDAEGKQLVYELLRAGVTREANGTAPFRVFLGNAPAVALQYNGSPVPIPRVSREGVARLTVGVTDNR